MAIPTPTEVINAAANAGAAKIDITRNAPMRLVVLSILAGAYVSIGAILSIIGGYGFPEITVSNPSMQRLISGCLFPAGLIMIVLLGAELFTGNNAMLIPTFMSKRCTFGEVLKNWGIVYVGNFVGAVLFAWIMVYSCGLTSNAPYHNAAIGIATAKVSMPWLTVFIKGVGANWCVCLALWLALTADSLPGKMVGCWMPVMAFVVLGYEHSIANMFFIPLGMMEGAQFTAWHAITANLIPATLGNIVGGALLVGAVHSGLHLSRTKTK